MAAREAAAVAVAAYPVDGRDAARAAALEAVANYGVAADDVDVAFDRYDLARGGTVSVRVTVRMPALVVPGVGTVGGFDLVGRAQPPYRRLPQRVSGMRPARRRHDERGTITLWVLGLCLCVLFLGGLSLDLWRGITVRRDLQAMADASAIAGADGLDEQSLRDGGAALDPARVRALVAENLAAQSDRDIVDHADVEVEVEVNQVVVRLHGHVRTSLLGVFLGDREWDVAATAAAEPLRLP